MERKLTQGDYVPDGRGGLVELDGGQEMLARVLFRLQARRGGLPFLPALGSGLHLVPREKPSARQALAAQYVAQALEEEPDLKVTAVEWTDGADQAQLTVRLDWQGERLTATLGV